MIFYFSATGNCKYVAAQVSKITGDKVVSMTRSGDCIKTFDIGEKESIGIVSPTYAWGLPSVVAEFLKSVKFTVATEKPYVFFIATYGTMTGNTGYLANKYFKGQTGMEIDAFFSIKMPDTWTPIFDLSDKSGTDCINKKAELEISDITEKIKRFSKGDYIKTKLPQFTVPLHKMCYEVIRKTKNFNVEAGCTGCGQCSEKCPVNAIEMKNGKPVWVKEKCSMCLGCLHRCPSFAIQYGSKTKRHGQYTNPNVKI